MEVETPPFGLIRMKQHLHWGEKRCGKTSIDVNEGEDKYLLRYWLQILNGGGKEVWNSFPLFKV